jgi:hypothetical protein
MRALLAIAALSITTSCLADQGTEDLQKRIADLEAQVQALKNKPPPPQQNIESPPARSNGFIRGPRGGCYTLSASGRKRYVDRSLCN